jgi:hypothetical protein
MESVLRRTEKYVMLRQEIDRAGLFTKPSQRMDVIVEAHRFGSRHPIVESVSTVQFVLEDLG